MEVEPGMIQKCILLFITKYMENAKFYPSGAYLSMQMETLGRDAQ
jgi:hypothetical protein